MGTYIWSYAVDVDKLRGAWGSKDKALVKRATDAKRVSQNAEWFKGRIAEGAPPLDQAIAEVVEGKLTNRKHAFQYVYAVEALARVIGTSVGDELKVGQWIETIWDPLARKVKGKPFEKSLGLHPVRLPMPIPKPTQEPYCSCLAARDVAAALGTLARMKAHTKAEPPEADIGDALEYVFGELDARLRGASKRRRGLVHFIY